MPELNKDGLIPGQHVEFEVMMRIKAEQNKKAVDNGKATREKTTSVRTSDESELQDTPKPTSKKKTKSAS